MSHTSFPGPLRGENVIASTHASGGETISFNFGAHDSPRSFRPFSTVPFPPDPKVVERTDIFLWPRHQAAQRSSGSAASGNHRSRSITCTKSDGRHQIPGLSGCMQAPGPVSRRHTETSADKLQLPGRDDPKRNVLQLVHAWQCDEENGPWMMVLDNADSVEVFFPGRGTHDSRDQPLAPFLPKSGRGSIIPSRNTNAAERLAGLDVIYKVPMMEKSQALQLLRNRLVEECAEDNVVMTELVDDLNRVPLAIAQAAAYIKRRRPHMSVSAYLNEFRRSDKKKASSSLTQVSYTSEKSEATSIDLEAALPEKRQSKRMRGLWHRILIVYRRLFTLVGIFNIAAALAVILSGIQSEWLGTVTAFNLALAVLIRQDFVINALYTITCSVPKSWPFAIRSRCAKIYHLGGIHSGAAISAGALLLASNFVDIVCMTSTCSNWGHQSLATRIISWMLSVLFFVMFVMAYPSIRKAHHDMFEKTHRFVGWTMLGLFWAQVVLTCNDVKDASTSLGSACVRSASFWLLAIATANISLSWAFLRKVPVQAEVLSDHAVRLHFDYTAPVNGSFTRLSKRPLLEWHSFATIPVPEPANSHPKGFSILVSNAGDWTKATIKEKPTHIWTRGVPTCGVMRIATLFNRIVLIATGSGIGPVLGHIQSPTCPTQLIWSTSRPEQTFGEDLCNVIKAQIPDAVIHDIKIFGRPDLVKMGYNLVKSFKAEAVIIIANEKITKKVVYGLETRGVPAYGAIWDS
ncbi:hypothetical protein B0T10DRAFT_609132 [Thelonectria olida]|uniref:Non-ribosomal peptide synthetase n=1 Tax=Thelonectria olida TaxID=1576542 RepID=A0A9P8VZV0_9HYPO|nr:hypothetical protein B0T10DRAFT_609132 [Thelonectria olida]